jgi:DNA polymerase III delta prime subunit
VVNRLPGVEITCLKNMLVKLKHPFTLLLAGPSGCGKTTFVCELLSDLHGNIDTVIGKVHWCYAEANAKPTFSCAAVNQFDIIYHTGVPESFDNENNEPILIILDDLMSETGSDAQVSELFTRGSHHRNISIILITQNIFHKGAHTRDISLNAKYIVLFKNPRDQAQFQHLARQIYPNNSRELANVYKDATEKPHSYLLIDLTQSISDQLRFRTDIFNALGCVCYLNRGKISCNEDDDIAKEQNTGEPFYSINSTGC